jgi:hypothetical protein
MNVANIQRSALRHVRQRYLDGDYVQLGASDWESSFSVPLREGAIDYARFIGADAVVYTANSHFDYNLQAMRTEHIIIFLARSSAAGTHVNSNLLLTTHQATTAFNWLQDTLHKPHASSVTYD